MDEEERVLGALFRAGGPSNFGTLSEVGEKASLKRPRSKTMRRRN